jgi:hypothetical protein
MGKTTWLEHFKGFPRKGKYFERWSIIMFF